MTTIKIVIEKDGGWDCEGSPRENLTVVFRTDGTQNTAEQIASSIAQLLAGFENIPLKATNFFDPDLTMNKGELEEGLRFARAEARRFVKLQALLFKLSSDDEKVSLDKIHELIGQCYGEDEAVKSK